MLAHHGDVRGSGPAVTLVPAHDRRGHQLRALLAAPAHSPSPSATRVSSRTARRRGAHGIAPRIVPLPGLGLDIDTPDDLRTFMARPAPGRTLDYLRESGIAARLLVTDAA